MNKFKNFLTYVISISFILASLLGIVHFCSFNLNFYRNEHDKILLYGKHINEHIGITNTDLDELTEFTLDYLNDNESSLDKQMIIHGQLKEVFNNEEKAHMVDVKSLNLTSVYVGIVSFVIFLISLIIYILVKGNSFSLYTNYRKTLIYALILFGFIGLWIIIDFDSFWTNFHHVFFSGNDLWLLNLKTDVLIMIVPPEFFNDLVTRIVICFLAVIVLFAFVLGFVGKRRLANDSHRIV